MMLLVMLSVHPLQVKDVMSQISKTLLLKVCSEPCVNPATEGHVLMTGTILWPKIHVLTANLLNPVYWEVN